MSNEDDLAKISGIENKGEKKSITSSDKNGEESFKDDLEGLEGDELEEEIFGEEITGLPDYDQLFDVLNDSKVDPSVESVERNDVEISGDDIKEVVGNDSSGLLDIERIVEETNSVDSDSLSNIIGQFLEEDKGVPTVSKENPLKPDKLPSLRRGSKEFLSGGEIQSFRFVIGKSLISMGYYLFSKKLRGIDFLAIKSVQVKGLVNHIFVVPVKILRLKGSVIVSEKNVKYLPFVSSNNQSQIAFQKVIKNIVKVANFLRNSIYSEGSILKFLKSYLRIDLGSERSFSGTVLYFRNGLIQYKVFVDPILVCQNKTSSSESSIVFPYFFVENLHVVNNNRFQSVVNYLEVKYKTIEKYEKERDTDIVQYFRVKSRALGRLKLLSIPLLLYSVVFLFLVAFQSFSVSSSFVLLGCGVITMSFLTSIYLCCNYYFKKKGVTKRSVEPYHKKKLELDDFDLNFLKEELDYDSLKQFYFECVTGGSKGSILEKNRSRASEDF